MEKTVCSANFFYKIKANDWENRKKQTFDMISGVDMTRNQTDDFWTDIYSKRNYIKPFIDTYQKELAEFSNEVETSKLEIKNIWSVKYDMGDFHMPHTHGLCNFTAILYLEYLSGVDSPTLYIDNKTDPITTNTIIRHFDAEEGDLIFFPANILHFTNPQKTEHQKQIISFNVSFFD